jgi:RND family efflux transporter MFP subunit
MSGSISVQSNRRGFPTRFAAVALLAVVAGGGFAVSRMGKPAGNQAGAPAASQESHAPEETLAPEVGVEVVSSGTLSEPIRVTGTLRTDEMVTISTKATGLVKRVYVKEGDRVRRNQLLVELDDSELRAQLARAEAAVTAADAQVREAEAAVRVAEAKLQQARTKQGITDTGAQSEYRRAEQNLAAAKARLAQAKSLAGIASTESETRVASARAAVQAARERLKALQDGSRKQEKAAAEAAVNRARSQVARMKSMLERREQLLRDKAIAAEVVDNARRDYEAALADLEAARQQLSLAVEGPRTEEIRAQEEVVRQAEAALRDAEANRARREISNEDVEAAAAQVRQAEAALEAAKANLAQSEWNQDEIRSTQAALNQARANVLRARAAAQQARADVRYQQELISQTRLYSPVDGVVTRRQVQAGAAVVQMRNELLTLVSEDTLYFEATAPETALPQLQRGLPVRVLLDAVPGKEFSGTVREIIPVAEGTNRSVRLRISFPRPPKAVVGGFARAEIQGRSSAAAISVPRAALVSDEGEMAVFVVSHGKAVRRPVTAGDPGGTGDRVPVISGLRSGEMIVVEGASSLVDGQEVTIKAEGSR